MYDYKVQEPTHHDLVEKERNVIPRRCHIQLQCTALHLIIQQTQPEALNIV